MTTNGDAASDTAVERESMEFDVVIVGGGVVGLSVAYHLADMGCKEVVLLERDKLTSGTTWHAAGLMTTFGSTSETSVEMRKYTRELYARLGEETGQDTGFRRIGYLITASNEERLINLRRKADFARGHDIPIESQPYGLVAIL